MSPMVLSFGSKACRWTSAARRRIGAHQVSAAELAVAEFPTVRKPYKVHERRNLGVVVSPALKLRMANISFPKFKHAVLR